MSAMRGGTKCRGKKAIEGFRDTTDGGEVVFVYGTGE